MSYSRHQPIGYLGHPSLGGDDESYRYDRYWELICFPAQAVRDAVQAMHAWNSASPSMNIADQSNDFKEEENPVRGLRLLWIRLGKVGKYWPGAQGEYNFGPTTYTDDCPGGHRTYVGRKPSNTIRVDREFWNLVLNRVAAVRATGPSTPYPAALWQPNEDGYVRLRVDDPLLIAAWQALVDVGILAPAAQPNVSVKDDSMFVQQGLKKYYDEWVREIGEAEMRDPAGRSFWPSGINFGPNTSGDEIRIHPALLFRLLNRSNPRAAAAAQRLQTELRNTRIKPPNFSGLPSVRPGARPLGGSGMLRVPTRVVGGRLPFLVQLTGYLR